MADHVQGLARGRDIRHQVAYPCQRAQKREEARVKLRIACHPVKSIHQQHQETTGPANILQQFDKPVFAGIRGQMQFDPSLALGQNMLANPVKKIFACPLQICTPVSDNEEKTLKIMSIAPLQFRVAKKFEQRRFTNMPAPHNGDALAFTNRSVQDLDFLLSAKKHLEMTYCITINVRVRNLRMCLHGLPPCDFAGTAFDDAKQYSVALFLYLINYSDCIYHTVAEPDYSVPRLCHLLSRRQLSFSLSLNCIFTIFKINTFKYG